MMRARIELLRCDGEDCNARFSSLNKCCPFCGSEGRTEAEIRATEARHAETFERFRAAMVKYERRKLQ
jgi:hypothetical protein